MNHSCFYSFALWVALGPCGVALANPGNWRLRSDPDSEGPQDQITRTLNLPQCSLESLLQDYERDPVSSAHDFQFTLQSARALVRAHRLQIAAMTSGQTPNSEAIFLQRKIIDLLRRMKGRSHYSRAERGWLGYVQALLMSDQALNLSLQSADASTVEAADAAWQSALENLRDGGVDLAPMLVDRAQFRFSAYEQSGSLSFLEGGISDLETVIEHGNASFDVRFKHVQALYHQIIQKKSNWSLDHTKSEITRAIDLASALVPLTPPQSTKTPQELITDLRSLLSEIEDLQENHMPQIAARQVLNAIPLPIDELRKLDVSDIAQVQSATEFVTDAYAFIAPRAGLFSDLAKEDEFLKVLPLWTSDSDPQLNERVNQNWQEIILRNPERTDWLAPLSPGDIIYVPLSIRIRTQFLSGSGPIEANALDLSQDQLIAIFRRAIARQIERLSKLPSQPDVIVKIDFLTKLLERSSPPLSLQELSDLYQLSAEDSPEILRRIGGMFTPEEASAYLNYRKDFLSYLAFSFDLFKAIGKLTPEANTYWTKHILGAEAALFLGDFPQNIIPQVSESKRRYFLWIAQLVRSFVIDERRQGYSVERLETLLAICRRGEDLKGNRGVDAQVFQVFNDLWHWIPDDELFISFSSMTDTQLLDLLRQDHLRFRSVLTNAYTQGKLTREGWEAWRVRIEKARLAEIVLPQNLSLANQMLVQINKGRINFLTDVSKLRSIRELFEAVATNPTLNQNLRTRLLNSVSESELLFSLANSSFETFLSFKAEYPQIFARLSQTIEALKEGNRELYQKWWRLSQQVEIRETNFNERAQHFTDGRERRLFENLGRKIQEMNLSTESDERLTQLNEALSSEDSEALENLLNWLGSDKLLELAKTMDPETLKWFGEFFANDFFEDLEDANPSVASQWEKINLLSLINSADLDKIAQELAAVDPEKARLFLELARRAKEGNLEGESNERLGFLAEALASGGTTALAKLVEWIGPENILSWVLSMDPETLLWFAQTFGDLFKGDSGSGIDLDFSKYASVFEQIGQAFSRMGGRRNQLPPEIQQRLRDSRSPERGLRFPNIRGPNARITWPNFDLPNFGSFWDDLFRSDELELYSVDFDIKDHWPFRLELINIETIRAKANDDLLSTTDTIEKNIEAPYMTRMGAEILALPGVGPYTQYEDEVIEEMVEANDISLDSVNATDDDYSTFASPALTWLDGASSLAYSDLQHGGSRISETAAAKLTDIAYALADRNLNEINRRLQERHHGKASQIIAKMSLLELSSLFQELLGFTVNAQAPKWGLSRHDWRELTNKWQMNWALWLERFFESWKTEMLYPGSSRFYDYENDLKRVYGYYRNIIGDLRRQDRVFPGMPMTEMHFYVQKRPAFFILSALPESPFRSSRDPLIENYSDLFNYLLELRSFPEIEGEETQNFSDYMARILDTQNQFFHSADFHSSHAYVQRYVFNFLSSGTVSSALDHGGADHPVTSSARRNFMDAMRRLSLTSEPEGKVILDFLEYSYISLPNHNNYISRLNEIQILAGKLHLSEEETAELNQILIRDALRASEILQRNGFARYAKTDFLKFILFQYPGLSFEELKLLLDQTYLSATDLLNLANTYGFSSPQDRVKLRHYVFGRLLSESDLVSRPPSILNDREGLNQFLREKLPRLYALRESFKKPWPTPRVRGPDCENSPEEAELEDFLRVKQSPRDQLLLSMALLPGNDMGSIPDNSLNASQWFLQIENIVFGDYLLTGGHRALFKDRIIVNAVFYRTFLTSVGVLTGAWGVEGLDLSSLWSTGGPLAFTLPSVDAMIPSETPEAQRFYPSSEEGILNRTQANEGSLNFLSREDLQSFELAATLEIINIISLIPSGDDLENKEWSLLHLFFVNRAVKQAKDLGYMWIPDEGFKPFDSRIQNFRRPGFLGLPIRYHQSDLSPTSLVRDMYFQTERYVTEPERPLTDIINRLERTNFERLYASIDESCTHPDFFKKQILDFELEKFSKDAIDLSIAQDDQQRNSNALERKWRNWMERARTHPESSSYWLKSFFFYKHWKSFVRQNPDPATGVLFGQWYADLVKVGAMDDSLSETVIAEMERDVQGHDPSFAIGFFRSYWNSPDVILSENARGFQRKISRENPILFEIIRESETEVSLQTVQVNTPNAEDWARISVILRDGNLGAMNATQTLGLAHDILTWKQALSLSNDEINRLPGSLPLLVSWIELESRIQNNQISNLGIDGNRDRFAVLRAALLFPSMSEWLTWTEREAPATKQWFLNFIRQEGGSEDSTTPAIWQQRGGTQEISSEKLLASLLAQFWFIENPDNFQASVAPFIITTLSAVSRNQLPSPSTNYLESDPTWLLFSETVSRLTDRFNSLTTSSEPTEINLQLDYTLSELRRWARRIE